MIFVLADDFSGAAEIAGIGFRYGLNTVLQTEPDPSVDAELLVVDSDTRSLPEREAASRITAIAGKFNQINAECIYKKIDSVLRGHVLAEIRALMTGLGLNHAVIAPANPSAGRTIAGGYYYIDGIPLDQTGFAEDPEYPATTADVNILLGTGSDPGIVDGDKTRAVIMIRNIRTREDLARLAKTLPEKSCPAGSSDFFETILEKRGLRSGERSRLTIDGLRGEVLVVLGSAGRRTADHVRQLQSVGFLVCTWPGSADDINRPAAQDRWTDALDQAFRQNEKVVMTSGLPLLRSTNMPAKLITLTAKVVRSVCTHRGIRTLFVEGGATASGIVRHIGWRTLHPLAEYATGVVGLRVSGRAGFQIIVKPGSYPWPAMMHGKPDHRSN